MDSGTHVHQSELQKSDITKCYASRNLHAVTKQQIVNKESVLNKEKIDMLIIFGKMKETFDDLDINIVGIEAIDI